MISRSIRHWAAPLGIVLAAAFTQGCGAVAALANPKVMWAIHEPARMTVVVRRARAAKDTDAEVTRLLGFTPLAGDKSKWLELVTPSEESGRSLLKEVQGRWPYATQPAKVLASEAWVKVLRKVQSDEDKTENLLTLIDPGIGKSYAELVLQRNELTNLRAEQAKSKETLKDSKLDAKERATLEKEVQKLDEYIQEGKSQIEPLSEKFVATIESSKIELDGKLKDRLGRTLLSMRNAIEAARLSNSVALVRYPLAVPGVVSDLKEAVPNILADVVEERVGKRPVLHSLKPDLSLEGGKVELVLNGLTQKDIGNLKLDDVARETIGRTQSLATEILTLAITADDNETNLAFSQRVVDSLLEQLRASGWHPPQVSAIPDLDPAAGTGGGNAKARAF